MDFDDWYSELTKDEIRSYIRTKRNRKQGWWEFFEECFSEWKQEEAEEASYHDEMRWLGRNYWRI